MAGNIQYLRTDRAIQSAMLSLLGRKPFERITVQDILDEAPVSRATFYKHFHDKYEIVEKIQDDVLLLHAELRESMLRASPDQYPTLLECFSVRCKETCQLLMKVHTDRVNLPQALARECEQYYYNTSDSPNRALEAKVYAAASAAMIVAMIDGKTDFPLEQTFDAMVAVSLHMMGLPDTPEQRQLILHRRNMYVTEQARRCDHHGNSCNGRSQPLSGLQETHVPARLSYQNPYTSGYQTAEGKQAG